MLSQQNIGKIRPVRVEHVQQVYQGIIEERTATAHDLEPIFPKKGVSAGFVESISEIKLFSAEPLRIIGSIRVDLLKIQNELQRRVGVQQFLQGGTAIAVRA